jgi:hypothetical protein
MIIWVAAHVVFWLCANVLEGYAASIVRAEQYYTAQQYRSCIFTSPWMPQIWRAPPALLFLFLVCFLKKLFCLTYLSHHIVVSPKTDHNCFRFRHPVSHLAYSFRIIPFDAKKLVQLIRYQHQWSLCVLIYLWYI